MDYPFGWDVDWIAVDRLGRVGVFVTGGRGPVPVAYLGFEGSFEKVTAALGSLAIVSECEVREPHLNSPDAFVEPARRGLFVFDWSENDRLRFRDCGRYELVARPKEAITVDAVQWPSEIRQLLERVWSTTLDLDADTLYVTEFLECAFHPDPLESLDSLERSWAEGAARAARLASLMPESPAFTRLPADESWLSRFLSRLIIRRKT